MKESVSSYVKNGNNSMAIDKIQQEIIDEFSMFDDWMDKYEYLIELGKDLPLIDPQFKKDDYLIRGCQSSVWLHAELQNGLTNYTADSDAVISKGIIALLIRVLNRQPPKDVALADLYFIDEIGLKTHLSPNRSNGLVSMVKQMKLYALGLGQQQS